MPDSSLADALPATSSDPSRPVAADDTEKTDFDCRIKLYEIYRGYAVHEDTLVNNRMTWLLSIHGFLYATYGFTLQKKLEVAQRMHPRPHKLFGGTFDQVFDQVDLFLMLITCIGAVISWYAFTSIRAATSSVREVTKLAERSLVLDTNGKSRQLLIARRPLPDIAGAGLEDTLKAGSAAALTIPVLLLTGWVMSALLIIWPMTIYYIHMHIWIVPIIFLATIIAINVYNSKQLITAQLQKMRDRFRQTANL